MALRLVEIMLPADQAEPLRELLSGHDHARGWNEVVADGQIVARVVLDAECSSAIVDEIDEQFNACSGYQLIVIPVQAAFPRPDEPDDDAAEARGKSIVSGLSHEELYTEIVGFSRITPVFVLTVILSLIVAVIALLRGSVAVLVGAMVIAPLLGPNVALAFGSAVGDLKLVRRAVIANGVGVVIAVSLSVLVGLTISVDPSLPEIASRTESHMSDIFLALAAGCAGTLAVTTGISMALVGVMVAVALLPPTAVLGMMIGIGDMPHAMGALKLLATNVICVNLAGVVTFVLQGVRPRRWHEVAQAKRSMVIALTIWCTLLAGLIVLIV